MRSLAFLLVAVAPLSARAVPPEAPPAVDVALRIDAPDRAGPWKLVMTNQSRVPVRLAADGRLLRLEIRVPPSAEAETKPTPKSRKGPPPPVVCTLPAELRPTGVNEDRAVILAPGARYEEVLSPAFYCFNDAAAKALIPGAEVTARLGFPAPLPKGRKLPPLLSPPYAAEPIGAGVGFSPIKELISRPFVLPAEPAPAPADAAAVAPSDPAAPKVLLIVPARVDTANERSVGMTMTVKNTGQRPTALHLRRDNFVFDVDGPDGSSRCGQPMGYRSVAADLFTTLAPRASMSLDVWVGEMCPDVIFDRPGLYRIRASVAFPNASETRSIKSWTEMIFAKEPILVRVREGRLPFYSSPPQVLGGSP